MVNREALLDRVNEIMADLHATRHEAAKEAAAEALLARGGLDPQRLIASALPLDNAVIADYLRRQVLDEQRRLTDAMRGHVSTHEAMRTECMDDFKAETQRTITESCAQMADAVLARCLVDIVVELEHQQQQQRGLFDGSIADLLGRK